MLGLGQQLRSAREAQGLTLGEASAKIHIRAEYLGALEDEQWSMFADPIYVRGFLRTYAHFLELRAEVVVAQYNEIAPVGIKLLGPDTDETPKSGSGRVSLIFALLILFGGMSFAGYAFVTHAGSMAFALPNADNALPSAVVIDATPEAKPTPAPTVVSVKANPQPSPAPKATSAATVAATASGSVAASAKTETPLSAVTVIPLARAGVNAAAVTSPKQHGSGRLVPKPTVSPVAPSAQLSSPLPGEASSSQTGPLTTAAPRH